jgi:hypothetical protein
MITKENHPNHPVLLLAEDRQLANELTWSGSGHSEAYAPDCGLAVAYWPRIDDDGSLAGGGCWVALERERCPFSGAPMTISAVLYEVDPVSSGTPEEERERGAIGVGVPAGPNPALARIRRALTIPLDSDLATVLAELAALPRGAACEGCRFRVGDSRGHSSCSSYHPAWDLAEDLGIADAVLGETGWAWVLEGEG